MRLIVAEKPSLARAIAGALPGPVSRHRTHITCGDGNVVAWCAGHILEPAPPEAYGEHLARWRLGDLPIVPTSWKLVPSAPELLEVLEKLLGQADRVVHAGDPDREGQLLVDEVLGFLGYRGPVDRLLVSDLRPEAIAKALSALEPNAKHKPLSDAALARQRADWLYGINLSRLYTLLGRAGGYEGVLSVGRVQTPLLGLLVARDRAIADFQPRPYFALTADVHASTSPEIFRAHWVPGPSAGAHLDESRRLLRQDFAEAVLARVERAGGGRVTAHQEQPRSQTPPLPYALADLQVDAGKRLGLSAKAVLDACQGLYETHKLLTYPRSDCAYLPEGHLAQAPDVLAAIAWHAPSLRAAVSSAHTAARSKAWNDKKVTAHHAIIPTPSAGAPTPALSPAERAVYELVAKRYLGQFYGAHEYLHTQVELELGGETFRATGRQVLAVGWKVLWSGISAAAEGDAGEGRDEAASGSPLPPMKCGDAVVLAAARIDAKRTEPPKPFTDASLIAAMCGVAKHVSDPRIQKILTETDGIGTPATRAAILETLLARGYAVRQGKNVISTDTGRALVAALPPSATTPDMTAVWEAAMRAIGEERQSLGAFLTAIASETAALVRSGQALGSIRIPASLRSASRPRDKSSRRPPAQPALGRRGRRSA